MYQTKTSFIKTYLDEAGLNPDVGTWSWILHRASGLVLVLYTFMHFFALSSSLGGASTFNAWISNLQTTLTHLLEIGLIGVVAFHLLNGLRITVVDFFYLTKPHKTLFWVAMILFLVVMVITLIVFLPRAFSPHH
ncbi:MAG: succinate dehydrogenase, cytochrome b556 subunit [Gemmatimonadales bacterium]|nr:MAG: succinate dehydrogenase, cytochrome b556 subunit [Gemmatimonadales bacterium]